MLIGNDSVILKLTENETMSKSKGQVLQDLKKIALKRSLLDEELAKLSPELRAEIEVRKSLLINAMRQQWELPKQSQPLYEAINRKSERLQWPYWGAILFCAAMWVLEHFFNSVTFSANYVLASFFFASILHFNFRLDLIEMDRRFSWLSNEIKKAELTLYTYGSGFIQSFGSWHTRDEELRMEDKNNNDERFLRDVVFFVDMEESILINMKIIEPLQLTFKLHSWSND